MVRTFSGILRGLDAHLLTVEVDTDKHSFGFYLVGLADHAVREGQLRIHNAIRNAGYRLPRWRYLVNLAPADLRKEGAAYDLTIAVGMLAESGCFGAPLLADYLLLGELSLDGRLKPVRGVLPVMELALRRGCKGVLIPRENAAELEACRGIIPGIPVFAFKSLQEVVAFFEAGCPPEQALRAALPKPKAYQPTCTGEETMARVKGQALAKRALQVAAAGRHNVLLMGPPGCGKTLLAHCFAGLLGPMSSEDAWTQARIRSVMEGGRKDWSVGGKSLEDGLAERVPFRNPHHTITRQAMVGGGAWPQPGEVSLAHGGILFLDELPEFRREVLEALREPLEQGQVMVSRQRHRVVYPARFVLIAAMNPCPCGYFGSEQERCTCPEPLIQKYQRKVSGPLLDRMDLVVHMDRVKAEDLENAASSSGPTLTASSSGPTLTASSSGPAPASSSSGPHWRQPSLAPSGQEISHHPTGQRPVQAPEDELVGESRLLLQQLMNRGTLSMRACHRMIRVASTIAKMEQSEFLQPQHLMEAYHFRQPKLMADFSV